MPREGETKDEKVELDPKQFEVKVIKKLTKSDEAKIQILGKLLKKFEVRCDSNTGELTSPFKDGRQVKLEELEKDINMTKEKSSRILKILNDENLIFKKKINTKNGPVLNITLNLDNIKDKIKKRSR